MRPEANLVSRSPKWRSQSPRDNGRSEAASNHLTNMTRALQFQKSSVVSASAVSETVRRVNAQAAALLTRRAEINRRIYCLHRVVQGLRNLATNTVCAALDTVPRESVGTSEHVDTRSPVEQRLVQMRADLPVQSTRMLAGLSRACRIALMEAEEAASLDEIRSRIDRRGSFVFSDSGFAAAAIAETLNIMRDNGEIRGVKSGDQSLWQRTYPANESEF